MRRATSILAGLAGALVALGAPGAAQQVAGESVIVRATARAEELAREARAALAEGRHGEALYALQALLDGGGEQLLAGSDAAAGSEAPGASGASWRGAAVWAERELQRLPQAARELYRARHEQAAARALELARAGHDRAALARVAARWPLCRAAVSAWTAVGDLEWSAGEERAAELAWSRARARAAAAGLGDPPARPAHGAPAGGARDEERAFAGDSPAFSAGGSADRALAWTLELPPGPLDGRGAQEEGYNLFPVLAGETLLVSDSLAVHAVEARSGELLWSSAEAPGWEALSARARLGLFEGVDRQSVLVGPAVGSGVVVAALQIPFSLLDARDYQSITITKQLPDRRLFAFDLATGAPLWSRAPPQGWDGESGDVVTRNWCAGSPVVAAGRVLVPLCRLQGRIEIYVACFALQDGQTLWTTQVATGQRELNMFGRHEWEFCAPPVVVNGERVLALTQLGVVAALDFLTGAIEWAASYPTLALPSGRMRSGQRERVWRNAPPAVAGGLVVAAPEDSRGVHAFDLESGEPRGSVDAFALFGMLPRRSELDCLLGADGERVYFGGSTAAAFRWEPASGRFAPRPAWSRAVGAGLSEGAPRSLLGSTAVCVPGPEGVLLLARETGEPLTEVLAWSEAERGNVLLRDAAAREVWTLSGHALSAWLDWDLLLREARAALAAAPADPGAVLGLARLLVRRAELGAASGAALRAVDDAAEARELVAAELARPAEQGGAAPGSASRRALHALLASAWEAHADAALALDDPDGAQRALAAALEVELAEPRRAELLSKLHPFALAAGPEDLAALCRRALELAPTAPAAAGADAGATGPFAPFAVRALAALEYFATCDPLAAAPTALASERRAELAESLPLGLAAALELARIEWQAGRRESGVAVLQEALERWEGTPLGAGTASATDAESLLAALLRSLVRGAPELYATYEAPAQALLDESRARGDDGLTARLIRRYPASRAAREARMVLLESACARGDVETVAREVRASLASATALDAPLAGELALLGAALAGAGHPEFERALERFLARRLPDSMPPLAPDLLGAPHAPDANGASAAPEPAAAWFGLQPAMRASWPGNWRQVGWSGGGGGDHAVLVLVAERADESSAFGFSCAPAAGDAPVWRTRLPMAGAVAYAACLPEVVVLADYERACGLDPRSGALLWSATWTGSQLEGLAAADGVAVLGLRTRPGHSARARALARGLDARLGVLLWERELGSGWSAEAPIAGSGAVAFLAPNTTPRSPGRGARVLALELFTGLPAAEFQSELPALSGIRLASWTAAWIESGRLVVPGFQLDVDTERASVAAFDLERGQRAWTAELPVGQALAAVVGCAGRSYLVCVPGTSSAERGSLLELDVADGGLREIAALRATEEPIGLARQERHVLGAPWVFLQTRAEGLSDMPIRAVNLEQGVAWSTRLPIPYETLYDDLMPTPAVSDACAALAVGLRDPRTRLRNLTVLVTLDLASGATGIEERVALDPGDEHLDLAAAGPHLLLRVLHRSDEDRGRMEAWR